MNHIRVKTLSHLSVRNEISEYSVNPEDGNDRDLERRLVYVRDIERTKVTKTKKKEIC